MTLGSCNGYKNRQCIHICQIISFLTVQDKQAVNVLYIVRRLHIVRRLLRDSTPHLSYLWHNIQLDQSKTTFLEVNGHGSAGLGLSTGCQANLDHDLIGLVLAVCLICQYRTIDVALHNNRQSRVQFKASLRQILDNVFPSYITWYFYIMYGQYWLISTCKNKSGQNFMYRESYTNNKKVKFFSRNKKCKLRHTYISTTQVILVLQM